MPKKFIQVSLIQQTCPNSVGNMFKLLACTEESSAKIPTQDRERVDSKPGHI